MRALVAEGADPLLSNVEVPRRSWPAAGVGLHNLGENPGSPEEVADAVRCA